MSDSEKEFNATFFGIENLPMLQRVGNICMMDEVPDPTAPLNAWIQPEVWNMNDESTAGTGLNDTRYPTPTALRLVTFGASLLYNDFEMVTGDLVEFGDDFYNPTVDGTICFKNPSPATVNPTPFFAAPVLLKGFEKAPAARKYEDGTSPSGTENRYPQESTKITGSLNNNQFLAIYVGSVEVDPDAIPPLGGHRVSFSPSARLSFVLQYFDGSSWRPYSMLNRLEQLIGSQRSSNGKTGDSGWIGANGHVDPRTERFSGSVGRIGAGNNVRWQGGTTVRPVESTALATQGNGRSPVMQAWPRVTSGFTHYVTGGYYLFDTWIQNLPQNNTSFYADPDGVVRPGDGWRADIATGDGMIAYHKTTLPASATRRRPVILNRPFRSVGELGYVFRDQPFKSLDFWSEQSADAGLLDLFCVSEQMAPLMTGPVNPNAAPPRVLQAILHGATKEAGKPAESIKPAEASAVGDAVAGEIRANGPLANLSETVTRLSGPIHDAFAGAANTDDDKPINNKGYGEAPLRALSGNISDRIWNLLVDVSAQTGRIGSRAGGLEDFLVEGERRYWLHVAIDRTTGKIVDQQLEPYFE